MTACHSSSSWCLFSYRTLKHGTFKTRFEEKKCPPRLRSHAISPLVPIISSLNCLFVLDFRSIRVKRNGSGSEELQILFGVCLCGPRATPIRQSSLIIIIVHFEGFRRAGRIQPARILFTYRNQSANPSFGCIGFVNTVDNKHLRKIGVKHLQRVLAVVVIA